MFQYTVTGTYMKDLRRQDNANLVVRLRFDIQMQRNTY